MRLFDRITVRTRGHGIASFILLIHFFIFIFLKDPSQVFQKMIQMKNFMMLSDHILSLMHSQLIVPMVVLLRIPSDLEETRILGATKFLFAFDFGAWSALFIHWPWFGPIYGTKTL